MENLEILNLEELATIEGGGFFYYVGYGVGQACAFLDGFATELFK